MAFKIFLIVLSAFILIILFLGMYVLIKKYNKYLKNADNNSETNTNKQPYIQEYFTDNAPAKLLFKYVIDDTYMLVYRKDTQNESEIPLSRCTPILAIDANITDSIILNSVNDPFTFISNHLINVIKKYSYVERYKVLERMKNIIHTIKEAKDYNLQIISTAVAKYEQATGIKVSDEDINKLAKWTLNIKLEN